MSAPTPDPLDQADAEVTEAVRVLECAVAVLAELTTHPNVDELVALEYRLAVDAAHLRLGHAHLKAMRLRRRV